MIKEKNNLKSNLLDKDETKMTTKIKNNIFFILCIFYTVCISTICSLYIILIYQDVHDTYSSLQNVNLSNLNVTEFYEIRKQLEFLNNCFSEKYCKRVG
jgi:hypothetical protein